MLLSLQTDQTDFSSICLMEKDMFLIKLRKEKNLEMLDVYQSENS